MSRSDFELKTPEQFIAMRKAGLITAKALEAVRVACVAGVSTLELDRIANETIESFGAHSNFQLVAGYNHTICASINHEVVRRLAKRAIEQGRSDDTEDVIRNRMAIYEDQTAPLISLYAARGLLIMVDGLGEIDEVTSRIVEALNAKNQS